MNAIVISGEGFFKEKIYTKNSFYCSEIIWTKILSEAKLFKSSSANKFIERNHLNAFVWKFKEQHPIKKRFIVRKQYQSELENENDTAIWIAAEDNHISNSDVNYLIGRYNDDDYMLQEDAEKLAKEKNEILLLDLVKVLDLNKVNHGRN